MDKQTLDQKLKKIASIQYKMDTSGPFMKGNAEKYRRRFTKLELDKLGLSIESPEYKEAYQDVQNDIKKEKQEEAQNEQNVEPVSALSVLARIKQAIKQGGV